MNLWFDLKYAWRLLLKSPLHSVLCIGVVTLSVGLAILIYACAYGAWLKPLDIPGSQRWFVIHAAKDATTVPTVHTLDAYTYQELLKRNRTVKHLGAVSMRPGVLSEGQVSVNLRTYAISPSLLAAAQVAPYLGRVFADAEAHPDSAAVAILSFEAWANYFASDPAIVGKHARINGKPTQIVGVLPKGFSLGMWADLWLPLEKVNLTPAAEAMPVEPFISLEPTQTRAAVLQEMNASVDLLNQAYPERYTPGRHITVHPAHRAMTDVGNVMIVLLSIMTLGVALLGSMNIGMIFFARLMERSRELALRNALGASRWRLLCQCLLESSVVVLLGLVLGVTFGALGVSWLHNGFTLLSKDNAYVNAAEFVMRGQHVVVAVMAAIGIWLLSTLVPAWRIAQQDAAQVLAGSGKGMSNRGRAKGASFLVGLQVMISCLVVVVCSNAVLSEREGIKKPKGFTMTQIVVSAQPTTFNAAYAESVKRLQYFDALTASTKMQLKGAEVGFSTAVPTSDTFAVPMAVETQDARAVRDVPVLRLLCVSANYFKILGISLRRGRWFDSTDNDAALNVAIVDEQLAQRYWPNQDPLGKRIQLNPADNGPWLTVVGIASHVGNSGLGSFADRVYRPLRQSVPNAFVVIAKLPNPLRPQDADTHAALKAAAFAVDRDLPLNGVQSLRQLFEDRESRGPRDVYAVIAIVTAFLAATGLFGLISRSVELRTQEVGVRRALGATQWQVTALFLRQGVVHLAVGVVLGGGLGIIASSSLSSLYPDMLNHVVLVTLCVLFGVPAVIFAASYLPTRRAVALEPGDALRYE